MDKKPKTQFMTWLEAVGDNAAAQLLNEKPRIVKSWRLGERVPKRTKWSRITQCAPVKTEGIYS